MVTSGEKEAGEREREGSTRAGELLEKWLLMGLYEIMCMKLFEDWKAL